MKAERLKLSDFGDALMQLIYLEGLEKIPCNNPVSNFKRTLPQDLPSDNITCGLIELENAEFLKFVPKKGLFRSACYEVNKDKIEKYFGVQEQKNKPVEQDPIRQAVKRQYVRLESQMRVVGGGRAEDFIADRMVDMYRIAADRLGSSPQVLRLMYVDNDAAPEPLRELMSQYIGGKLTRDETIKGLAELKIKTEKYVIDLGAKPEDAQRPSVICQGTLNLEGRLMNDIIADSMRDDGSINQRHLFMNTAEIVIYDRWVGLAKSLGGKQPTADELIAAQIDAYKATHKANPSLGFNNGKEFQTWLIAFERTVRNEVSEYLQVTLPAYRSVAEKLAK